MSFVVAKVGGSLFDLAGLAERLRRWAASLATDRILLVAGGGRIVEEIRQLDEIHRLGPEKSHWLAIQAMAVNGELLRQLLDSQMAKSLVDAELIWRHDAIAIFDAESFCRADEASPDRLPHSWDVTSDSIAARIAVAWSADRLVLLKSASPPGSVELWADAGYCDSWMARVLAGSAITVSAVNLREIHP